MQKKWQSICSFILIGLIAAFVFPSYSLAVDPDMQALVIDNSSPCVDEPKNCDAAWRKLWKRAEKAKRFITRLESLCWQAQLNGGQEKKISKLRNRVYNLLVDLYSDASSVGSCCENDNTAFVSYLDGVPGRFDGTCDP